MKTENYLKRHYPNNWQEILNSFSEYQIENFIKRYKYKVGRITQAKGDNQIGDLVIYKYTKEIIEENENSYEYPNEGGWTGQFEYRYHFGKPSDMIGNTSYVKIFEEP